MCVSPSLLLSLSHTLISYISREVRLSFSLSLSRSLAHCLFPSPKCWDCNRPEGRPFPVPHSFPFLFHSSSLWEITGTCEWNGNFSRGSQTRASALCVCSVRSQTPSVLGCSSHCIGGVGSSSTGRVGVIISLNTMCVFIVHQVLD